MIGVGIILMLNGVLYFESDPYLRVYYGFALGAFYGMLVDYIFCERSLRKSSKDNG